MFSWVVQAIAYLNDPAHRFVAVGVGLFTIFILWRFIVQGIKIILFVLIIFIIFYVGLKYLAMPIT